MPPRSFEPFILRTVSLRTGQAWSVNSIVTVQSGFPFTPQLGYNPTNNGDTRNPVRPFVNPEFQGPVILGKPSQWFNPNAFLPPPVDRGFYGELGRNTLLGPGLARWDFLPAERDDPPRTTRLSISRGNFQPAQPGQFQHPESHSLYAFRGLGQGRSNQQHIYHVAADSIRIEADLVTSLEGPGLKNGRDSRV